MKYCRLGKTGFDVSAVVYGGIVSSTILDDRAMEPYEQAGSDKQVAWAVDQGINYFDVAPTYGNAQEMLGHSLAPYRNRIYLACKTEERLRVKAQPLMEESLRLLKTDYFDVYQMHALKTMEAIEAAFGPGGVMEMMQEMKENGTARNLGITAHSEAVALKAIELYDFDTVLFPFNWHMNMAYGMGNTLVKKAKEKGMGVLCMKSMIERAFSSSEDRYASKYPKSWCKPFDVEEQPDLLMAAVKYALSLNVDTIVPPGNYHHFRFAVEHIDEMIGHPITEEEMALLKEHLEKVRALPFFDASCYTV